MLKADSNMDMNAHLQSSHFVLQSLKMTATYRMRSTMILTCAFKYMKELCCILGLSPQQCNHIFLGHLVVIIREKETSLKDLFNLVHIYFLTSVSHPAGVGLHQG